MIRRSDSKDFEAIWSVVNDGARAYRAVIAADCLSEPYMSREELSSEIAAGVEFWVYEEDGHVKGVMGRQALEDVTLIRHAYVLTDAQQRGIGGQLLSHLMQMEQGPLLVGTWADAKWAIRFYERFGFRLVGAGEKDALLRRYWNVPRRQAEVSVVLVRAGQDAADRCDPRQDSFDYS